MTLIAPAVLFIGFLSLCYVGELLMRLVMVQSVEARSARCAFAVSFALSMSLLAIVLMNTAAESSVVQYYLLNNAAVTMNTDARNNAMQEEPAEAFMSAAPQEGYHGQQYRRAFDAVRISYAHRELIFQYALLSLILWVVVACPFICWRIIWKGIRSAHSIRQQRKAAQKWGAEECQRVRVSGRWRRRGKIFLGILLFAVVCVAAYMSAASVQSWLFSRGAAAQYSHVSKGARESVQAAWTWTLRTLFTTLQMPQEVQARNAPPSSGSGSSRGGADGNDAPRLVVRNVDPHKGLMSRALMLLAAQVATLGVASMGLLSGYATFMSPYGFVLPYVYYRNKENVLVQAKLQLAKKQKYLLNMQATKQRRIAVSAHETQSQLAPSQTHLNKNYGASSDANNSNIASPLLSGVGESGAAGSPNGGRLSRIFKRVILRKASPSPNSFTRRSARASAAARKQLLAEVEGVRYLSLTLFLQMDEVSHMLRECRRGRTMMGFIYAIFGVLLGLYAAVKVALTVSSLLLFRLATQDPVTQTFALLESMGILPARLTLQVPADGGAQQPADATAWQHHTGAQIVTAIALLVNAWMVISSIRGLLLLIFQLTISFRSVVTADTTAVVLSALMGVYFIGQLVMLRQSLPRAGGSGSASEHVLFSVLGPLPIYFYQRLNDLCFMMGFTVTMLVRKFLLGDPAAASANVANG